MHPSRSLLDQSLVTKRSTFHLAGQSQNKLDHTRAPRPRRLLHMHGLALQQPTNPSYRFDTKPLAGLVGDSRFA